MTANHQPETGDVAQPYFKQRRFLREARRSRPGPGRKRHSARVLMILAMVGAFLFLWAQPAAAAPTITEFHVSNVGVPQGITAGSDGNLWFTDRAGLIVKMPTAGKFTTFNIPRSNGSTDDITTGPDGNLWFTVDGSNASRIGRITPSGTITLFPFPSPENSDYLYLSGITKGPDGNLWFTYQDFTTNANAIGRITTGGTINLFLTPTANSGPTDITSGPDGNLWFTEAVGNIGRITTS